MSVTTQPTTFADLYTLVLNQVRSQTSQANTLSQAKRAVNMALQDMHLGSDYGAPGYALGLRL
jgi:flagellar hook-associated protein FlgK